MPKKKTQSEVANEISQISNYTLELISKYINIQTSLTIKCLICNHKFNTYLSKIRNGKKCPNCNKNENTLPLTLDIIKNQLEITNSSDIEIVSMYKKTTSISKIKGAKKQNILIIYCKKCKKSYHREFRQQKNNPNCPNCKTKKEKPTTKLYENIIKTHYPTASLNSEYINSSTKLKIYCKSCNQHSLVRPQTLKFKRLLPCCKKQKELEALKIRQNEVYKYIKNVGNSEYIPISEYKNLNEDLILKHIPCGNTYTTTFKKFRNLNNRCPFCSKKGQKWSFEKLNRHIKDITNNEYSLLSKFKSEKNIEYIIVHHKICNQSSKIKLSHFLYRNTRCHHCKSSKGEKNIEYWLIQNNIQYISQYSITIENSQHFFDFFLPSHNLFIEFDGKQHFEPVPLFGGHPQFLIQKQRDQIKNEYVKSINKKLLRIPFYELNNISNILEKNIIN